MADNFSIKYFMEILILVLFGLGALLLLTRACYRGLKQLISRLMIEMRLELLNTQSLVLM